MAASNFLSIQSDEAVRRHAGLPASEPGCRWWRSELWRPSWPTGWALGSRGWSA